MIYCHWAQEGNIIFDQVGPMSPYEVTLGHGPQRERMSYALDFVGILSYLLCTMICPKQDRISK